MCGVVADAPGGPAGDGAGDPAVRRIPNFSELCAAKCPATWANARWGKGGWWDFIRQRYPFSAGLKGDPFFDKYTFLSARMIVFLLGGGKGAL